ncbi:hypothetical protein, partial [Klebsiella aerogenes]|uniref:hypothetical protein n=1 Tax=Klebsiella aerogenes TaxID=548 RepID=UPI001954312A
MSLSGNRQRFLGNTLTLHLVLPDSSSIQAVFQFGDLNAAFPLFPAYPERKSQRGGNRLAPADA